MNLTFFSCVTEEPPSTAKVTEVETNQAVEDARAWFGPQEEFVVQNDFGPAAKAKTRIKKIHWDRAITHENGRVIEVEVTYNTTSVPVRSAKTIQELKAKQKAAFFRLILVKTANEEYHKFLMMYFPETENANQRKLEINNYSTLSSSFSGDLQVVSWDEELAEGWYIQKGEVVNRYVPKNVPGKKERSHANAALNCPPVMEEICYSYGDDGQMDCSSGVCELPEFGVECFEVIAYQDPACYQGSGGPGYYGGPGGGGGSGSGGSGSGSGGGPTLLLEDQLVDKPFALIDNEIPCAVILKWLAAAVFKPDQSIVNKLSAYSATYPQGDFMLSDVANIQYIDNAYSKVVNMDYFSVTVSTLPMINGSRATPQQFLGYIRTNINSFTDQSLSTFSPLQWGTINETGLWNSSNPTGAVVTIDIGGPENGSVVTSFSSPSKWIFTTIRDPKYGTHPVSGNREFGYIANSNGTYTFYTRGVDRLTTGLMSFAEDFAAEYNVPGVSPFTNADNLWKSFQNKVRDFVNQNGGAASKLAPEILRPSWQDVVDVINGDKPLSTLSKDC